MSVFEEYSKRKDFLICMDSDGCVMDTMDMKHMLCFGPCMIQEWNLEPWQEPIQKRWNEINLYTMTRGINRFLGLALALEEVNQTFQKIDGIQLLSAWAHQAPELSNESVKKKFEETGHPVFKKALEWSKKVNQEISKLSDHYKKPFPNTKEGIEAAHRAADLAIVSSANADAVKEEWEQHGFMEYMNIALTQNEGSKAWCLEQMLKKGYEKDHVLMVGDAPGDKKAAEKNGILYYPILVKREGDSWKEFVTTALPRLLEGTYRGSYQESLNQRFEENLKGE